MLHREPKLEPKPLSDDEIATKSDGLTQAIGELQESLGRQPKHYEIAKCLGMLPCKYREMLAQLQNVPILTPEQSAGNMEIQVGLRTKIASVIDDLPKNEQLILSMRYKDNMPFSEIANLTGGILEVTARGILVQAVHRIRAALAKATD